MTAGTGISRPGPSVPVPRDGTGPDLSWNGMGWDRIFMGWDGMGPDFYEMRRDGTRFS